MNSSGRAMKTASKGTFRPQVEDYLAIAEEEDNAFNLKFVIVNVQWQSRRVRAKLG